MSYFVLAKQATVKQHAQRANSEHAMRHAKRWDMRSAETCEAMRHAEVDNAFVSKPIGISSRAWWGQKLAKFRLSLFRGPPSRKCTKGVENMPEGGWRKNIRKIRGGGGNMKWGGQIILLKGGSKLSQPCAKCSPFCSFFSEPWSNLINNLAHACALSDIQKHRFTACH